MPQFFRALRIVAVLLVLLPLSPVFANEPRAGQVVWWGKDIFWKNSPSDRTNGVVESSDEILTNIVGIAAPHLQAFLLTSAGAVFTCGLTGHERGTVPTDLSNVVSIAQSGGSLWAIRRNGSVARWGGDEDHENIVTGLSNITTISSAGYQSYLALRNDGTMLGFRLVDSTGIDPTTGLPIKEGGHSPLQPVKVRGQVLSNVVALASMGDTPLVLKNDGMVLRLGSQTPGATPMEPALTQFDEKTVAINMGGERWQTPFHYTSADSVTIDGRTLRSVAALAAGGGHALALKSNGTVVAWGNNNYGETVVPDNLSNVVAISAAEHLSLALKRDGTVTAWGGNYFGQTSVPAGLSNVVAIAAGGWFSMAITTGAVPASVYVQPHGRLEEQEREADFIFKGQVISSKPVTNASFPDWGKPHATQFKVISVLKGNTTITNPIFWHNTAGPMAWGGGTPPSHHSFKQGQSYLVFAVNLDRPTYLYDPPPDTTNRSNEFRQTRNHGVTLTLDARPTSDSNVKNVHWKELNLLLADTNPTNQIYAIGLLNELSPACGPHDDWGHTADFKREAVLQCVQPLLTNSNDEVAMSAFNCFQLGGISTRWIHGYDCWLPTIHDCPIAPTDCLFRIIPFADGLIAIANSKATSARRAAALAALSGTRMLSVSNSLPQWLTDPDEVVRAIAVQLLPEYEGEFCRRSLRDKASDASPMVRAAVADAIGKGKMEELLPTLEALFAEQISPKERQSPCFHKYLQLNELFGAADIRDVHTSAGYALLGFEATPAGNIFKAHLDDPEFGSRFLCKLAAQNPREWLDEMAKHLEVWITKQKQQALGWGGDPEKYEPSLAGPPFRLWEIMCDHFQGEPFATFANNKSDRYLNLLERAGTSGSREPLLLYELYKMQGLNKRAAKYRSECEGKYAVYNLKQFFDKIDSKYPMNGMIPDQ